MKRFFIVFSFFCAFFLVSCGSGSSKNDDDTEKSDSEDGEVAADEDTSDIVPDSDDIDDISDTLPDDPEPDDADVIEGSDNDSELSDPCDPNPCAGLQNSTEICTVIAQNLYSCGCIGGYYWWGAEKGCMNKRLSLGNICTGNNKCYDNKKEIDCSLTETNFYGQDAQYAELGSCLPQNFTVKTLSGQNIVMDNNTGLEWQQTLDKGTYTREEAENYCDSLNASNYAGYSSGWRLPAPHEFLTIVDNSKYDPAVDTTIFPDIPAENPAYFWASKTYYEFSDARWSFDAHYGQIELKSQNESYYVMCVHGEELPSGLFSVSDETEEESVVTDSTTGLVWQQNIIAEPYRWQDALSYCENLVYAGLSDWRLPNKNELYSLVNFDISIPPYSDFPASSDVAYHFFWSSSTSVDKYNQALVVYFNYGSGFDGQKSNTQNYYVRCVRNAD